MSGFSYLIHVDADGQSLMDFDLFSGDDAVLGDTFPTEDGEPSPTGWKGPNGQESKDAER